MAGRKITEETQATTIREKAHVLVTQDENGTESLRRVCLDGLIGAVAYGMFLGSWEPEIELESGGLTTAGTGGNALADANYARTKGVPFDRATLFWLDSDDYLWDVWTYDNAEGWVRAHPATGNAYVQTAVVIPTDPANMPVPHERAGAFRIAFRAAETLRTLDATDYAAILAAMRFRRLGDETLSVNGAAAESVATKTAIANGADAACGRALRDDAADWAEISARVKAGLGAALYPVGTLLTHYIARGAAARVRPGSTGITGVTLDEADFLAALRRTDSGIVSLEYNGHWRLDGNVVTLSDIGVTVTGTAAAGDAVDVVLTRTRTVWRVVGHDHHETQSGAAHTMTVEMVNAYGSAEACLPMAFDAPEAFYLADDAVGAGIYSFTLAVTLDDVWTAGSYHFTLTQGHPAGSDFRLICEGDRTETPMTGMKVAVYESRGAAEPAEIAEIVSGASGTSLGEMGLTAGTLNAVQRVMHGSNDWQDSNLRQWLNSDGDGTFTPQTAFDTPPETDWGLGFLCGAGTDFIAALGTAEITCRAGQGVSVANDTVFLLSQPEIWGTCDVPGAEDGEQLEWYAGLTSDSQRAHTDEFGESVKVWTRSPYMETLNVVRTVKENGQEHRNAAWTARGVCACAVIE